MEILFIEASILHEKWYAKILRDYNGFSIRKKINISKINHSVTTKNLHPPTSNKLQTEGANIICMALQNIRSLERLSLENNDLDDYSVDAIAAVFASNTTIKQLWISSNLFSNAGLSRLLIPLQLISALEVLDLANSKLSPQVALHIATVICSNTNIRQLWFEHNSLTDSGIIVILKVLMTCMYFVVVSLRSNGITEQSANMISEALAQKIYLEQLYLGDNSLTDVGVIQIMPSLTNAQGLHTLDLSNTNITEVSVDSIVAVINSSSQLQQLFLGDNKLCSSGAIKIVRALQGSHTIQVLGLSHNHITCEAAGEISIAVSSMPYLSTMMLDSNELGVNGVCTIIEGVQELNWLMILSVTDNVNSEEEEEYEVLKTCFADNTKFMLYM